MNTFQIRGCQTRQFQKTYFVRHCTAVQPGAVQVNQSERAVRQTADVAQVQIAMPDACRMKTRHQRYSVPCQFRTDWEIYGLCRIQNFGYQTIPGSKQYSRGGYADFPQPQSRRQTFP